MNNLARQNYFKPSPLQDNKIANNFTHERMETPYQGQTNDYIQFRNIMRAEKRQSFWTGVAMTAGIVFIFTLFFISMSSTGKSFMTCHEFGETFTCRLGGM